MLTSIPGSSEYFKGSVIAYYNDIKQKVLNVNKNSLIDDGAVSEKVVEQMCLGLIKSLGVDFAIAVSGIAGPSGGTLNKPIGTVWISVSNGKEIANKKYCFGKNREMNIELSSTIALNELRKFMLSND